MRHILGYLICLGFVSLILTQLGVFPSVYAHSDAVMVGIVDKLKANPVVGPTVQQAARSAEAASHDRVFGQIVSLLGRLVAMTFSPVGAIALVLYSAVVWILE